LTTTAAFFDVDGTLTTTRVWEGIMTYFRSRNLRRATDRLFWAVHTPYYLLHKRGLISQVAFRTPWAAHLAWYFRNYSEAQAGEVWDWVVWDYLSSRWREDTRTMLDRHRYAGDLVMLVSAGPAPLLKRIAAELGADHIIGTDFEIRNGRYTGRSLKPICIDENKSVLTRAYLEKLGEKVDLEMSYAYADAVSDLALLEMVGNPVAVYPGESLRTIATERGWRVFPS
jgi:HAD superfamily hydrolase (TIGR01490 family)